MYFDPLYILVLLAGFALIGIPSFYVKNTYQKYSKIYASCGLTGAEIAKAILKKNGLSNDLHGINIELTQGKLSDHYDPRSKSVRLSEEVYYGRSISAISISAHEVGHALQHYQSYSPLKLREAFLPAASIGDKLGIGLLVFGMIAMFWLGLVGVGQLFAIVGIALYATVVLFQIATLPVEFNASSRALKSLKDFGFVNASEIKMSKHVLVAAALTYVATALYAMLNLLYYVYIFFGSRKD